MKSLSNILCTALRGVGPYLSTRLQKLNLHTLQDLLLHLPLRYEDKTRLVPIKHLNVGDTALVEGIILESYVQATARKPSFICLLQDDSGAVLTVRFFYTTPQQRKLLQASGIKLRCFGEVRLGRKGREMLHPEYKILPPGSAAPIAPTLTPVYPTTEGLQQAHLRKFTEQALQQLQAVGLPDYLPPTENEVRLDAALHYLHRPPATRSAHQLATELQTARQRLAFEELLAHQLSMRQVRATLQQQVAPTLENFQNRKTQFLKQLPFQLTAAQQRVSAEIAHDLAQAKPMLRLVQGDVGSGKTVVAALALLQAMDNGYQGALMAPTELLAEQHFQTLQRWMEPLGVLIVLLTGKLTAKLRRQALEGIQEGTAHIIVGTQALFQTEVQFAELGLVITDEQHRFGVQQRLNLWQKGQQAGHYFPHQLMMTATPIPRSLAMMTYAELDCSVLDELPPGRKPIKTVLIANTRRDEIMVRMQTLCAQGRQIYWVCTLIEESEELQCQAAEAAVASLTQALPKLRFGLVHGKLKSQEKEAIMKAFRDHQLDVLVATTVIEVGVDVPNASLMVIENPERLGLSQLHQLRGRIGRGQVESHCILLYQSPLSPHATQRLQVMRETQDGFIIAQKDLELRGPGEMLGTRQTGLAQFKIADLMQDSALLPKVQTASDYVIRHHSHTIPDLVERWIPQGEHYAQV
ncbi:MAG: ATP-dependent DNA helicase RecG [Gammaproteobacteria bacterium]